jgi:DnaK suppressor protein
LGRLKVLPFTRLCVKCQEENEKESKRQKSLDEERGYRRLVLTDFEEEGS